MSLSADQLFSCTQCGECCRGFGGTYVSEEDIAAIAEFLGKQQEEVRRDFCQPSGSRLVLAQGPAGFCVFFDQNCSIHPVKPRMCRRWPFIPAILADPANWEAMAHSCPGMKPGAPATDLTRVVADELEREKQAAR